jgi:hypothetical protein
MTWSVVVINKTGGKSVFPCPKTLFKEGDRTIIFTEKGHIELLDIGHQAEGPHNWCVQVTSGNSQQRWWYDGPGECTLILDAHGSFELTGQDQKLTGKISGGVANFFELPPAHRIYITAVTNAAWQQKAILTIDGGGTSMLWQGAGEDNRELADLAIETPYGKEQVLAAVFIQYSKNGSGSWSNSMMSEVGTYSLLGFNTRTVVSEDGFDKDYNDCGFSCQWWSLPK